MSVTDDLKTASRTRLSFATEAEIDEFVEVLGRFERGEIAADAWRTFRLARGTYGQRQTGDVYMLRVKIPQGIFTASQLLACAEIAEQYSRGFGHITTRQNVQFHFVRLHDVEPALRRLADVGLTTRGACGNAVRNVTACPYAGVAPDEVFDVTPYAEALTRYVLRHPLALSLPRKFKIAFEGCAEDHQATAVNDIGLRARLRVAGGTSERGFRVTAGGGTSILCQSGGVLYDFLPAGDLLNVTESIIRVFHRLGDYKHKRRNRMKFLMRDLGWEKWRAEFERELAKIRAEGGLDLPFDPQRPPVEEAPLYPRPAAPPIGKIAACAASSKSARAGATAEAQSDLLLNLDGSYERWLRTNVRPQKQAGYTIAAATVPLGDLTAEVMRAVADLASAFSDGAVRITVDQNIVFTWVEVRDLPALYQGLAAAGLGLPDANSVADVISCPGAETCRIAVTQSRGLARVLNEHLRSRPDLVDAARDMTVKISGCPNGCGQHHIASVGLQGGVRKVDGRAIPQYFVMLGGSVEDEGARFGWLGAKIPARRVARALERLIELYATDRVMGETPGSFFRRVDRTRVRILLSDLERLTPEDASAADFVDYGEQGAFAPVIKDGECNV